MRDIQPHGFVDGPITNEFVDEVLLAGQSDHVKSELERFEHTTIPKAAPDAQKAEMRMAFLCGAKSAQDDSRQPIVIDTDDRNQFMKVVEYFLAMLTKSERAIVLKRSGDQLRRRTPA